MSTVREWLASFGMSEYAELFATNRIDFSVLRDLTDLDLEKLGVVLGDRRKMMRAIRDSPHDPELSDLYSGKAVDYDGLGQNDQAIESARRAIAINPKSSWAQDSLSVAFLRSGQFEKNLEYFDNLIRLDPQDSDKYITYTAKSRAHFSLKQHDQAIDSARRAIAINPNSWIHAMLAAGLALNGSEAEAHEALQRYLALPEAVRTIAAFKSIKAQDTPPHTDPRYLEAWDRYIDGLRKAGLPEG